MSILRLLNIKKSFVLDGDNKETVLNDINLNIKEGSFTVIYGPSGCGKSTLLNLISGLDSDYLGDIYFKNQLLKELTSKELTTFRRDNIGFVFQNFNLIAHMSVLDNILIPMYLNGKSHEENIKKAKEYLDMVELSEHMNKNVTKLSGGQKQRVAIARAIANNPDVIIADEPTGALDSKSQSRVLEILKKISNEGKTVILVTHNDEIENYADHIIRLKDGKIISETKRHDKNLEISKNSKINLKFNSFTFINAFKIAFSNFMDRKWRNILISLATSIGITGIILSLGLGNGIVNLIENDMNGGSVPSQIQVSLNPKQASGTLNINDQNYLKEKIGKENIRYMESPFGISMTGIDIENIGSMDFTDTMPNYSQIVSLYQNTEIRVSVNTAEEIIAGKEYKNPEEKGLTITESFINDFNLANNLKVSAVDLIGKSISIQIVENSINGEKKGEFDTKIARVIKDEFEDNNSFMSEVELQKIIDFNNFTKSNPFILIELNNPKDNEKVAELIMENKKYSAFSQTDIVNLVINFVKIIQGLLIALSSQAIIVSIVMISVILYINIIERTREIGVMKAVGYQNKDINNIFSFEALIITLFSLIISIISAFSIGVLINYFVEQKFSQINNVFSLDFSSIIYTIILSIVMALIASAIPMLKIGKLDPSESIRYE